VATFAAQLSRYDVAYAEFERVAAAQVDNNLTKWSVREHLLKAGLCRLANGDLEGARKALERYDALDVSFATTREGQFLKVHNHFLNLNVVRTCSRRVKRETLKHSPVTLLNLTR